MARTYFTLDNCQPSVYLSFKDSGDNKIVDESSYANSISLDPGVSIVSRRGKCGVGLSLGGKINFFFISLIK